MIRPQKQGTRSNVEQVGRFPGVVSKFRSLIDLNNVCHAGLEKRGRRSPR